MDARITTNLTRAGNHRPSLPNAESDRIARFRRRYAAQPSISRAGGKKGSRRSDEVPVAVRVSARVVLAQGSHAAHEPDLRLAGVVLPEDVGLAVAIEIARADDVIGGAGVRAGVALSD